MAQRDSTAPDVHLLVWQRQLVLAVHGHGCEGLVHFDDIDVADAEVVLVQQLRDGDGGPDAHDARREAGDGGADEFGEDGLAELDGARALH